MLTPILGSLFVTWFRSAKTVIIIGLTLMILATIMIFLLHGHNNQYFSWCLTLLVLGTGFVRSNIPALLGKFQDAGGMDIFTKFYITINGGSLMGVLCCGVVSEIYGWQVSFIFPMIASVIALGLALKLTSPESHNKFTANDSNLFKSILCLCVAILIVYTAVTQFNVYVSLNILLLTAALIHLLMLVYKKKIFPSYHFHQLIVYASVHLVFLALYEQGNLSLTLFIDKHVDRHLPGFIQALNITTLTEWPVSNFRLIDPILNIVLGNVFLKLWKYLEYKNRHVSLAAKFLIGLSLTASAFMILALTINKTHQLTSEFIIAVYALLVLAELCFIPTGLAFINKIAPVGQKPLFMGFWCLNMGFSQWLALSLAKLTVVPLQNESSLSIISYQHSFMMFSYLALAVMTVLIIIKVVEQIYINKTR